LQKKCKTKMTKISAVVEEIFRRKNQKMLRLRRKNVKNIAKMSKNLEHAYYLDNGYRFHF